MPITTEEQLGSLRIELRIAAEAFVAAALELELPAANLVAAESALRVAEYQYGCHEARPQVRELAVEIVAGLLQSLRPYLRPSTTRTAAMRAAEILQGLES